MPQTYDILIVDDSPYNLDVLGQILMQAGYRVRPARDGEIALTVVRKVLPDLILLDIMMPEMDGYDVCQQLKADARTRDIPIIFISALVEPTEKVKAFQVGGVDYITKPFQAEEVLARVQTHLALHEAQQQLQEKNAQLQWEIAESKRTAEALRKLSRAVEQSASTIVITDLNGTIEFVNPAFSRITGYSAQEAIGQNPKILQSGHHSSEFYQKMWETLTKGEVWQGEILNKKKNGEFYWEAATISPVKDAEGKMTHYLAVKDDVTTRKQAEAALQQRNQELSLLNQVSQMFSSSLDLNEVLDVALDEIKRLMDVFAISFWLIDPATGELVCMHAKGPGSQELIGQHLALGQGITGWAAQQGESLIVPDAWADERHVRSVDEKTGVPVRSMLCLPLRVQDKGIGVLNVVDVKVQRFSPNDLVLLEPIAAAAAIAIENARLYTRLQELNASKDKFFSIISHDLRSPFNSLLGFTQLLSEHLERYTPEEIKRRVITLRTAAERLYALLENLLTWSRIQRGMMAFQPNVFDIRQIIADNVDLFASKAKEKQIELTNTIQAELLVYADQNMVDTVVRNLVGNALKFTNNGGVVSIAADEQDAFVVIAVSDTGEGIPQEDISKLFRIDVHHTNPGTAGEKGTGLGLILCKDLVEKNGGRIWAESEVGAGSVFRFTLPISRSPKNSVDFSK